MEHFSFAKRWAFLKSQTIAPKLNFFFRSVSAKIVLIFSTPSKIWKKSLAALRFFQFSSSR